MLECFLIYFLTLSQGWVIDATNPGGETKNNPLISHTLLLLLGDLKALQGQGENIIPRRRPNPIHQQPQLTPFEAEEQRLLLFIFLCKMWKSRGKVNFQNSTCIYAYLIFHLVNYVLENLFILFSIIGLWMYALAGCNPAPVLLLSGYFFLLYTSIHFSTFCFIVIICWS